MDYVKSAKAELKKNAKPERAKFEKNYLKSELKFLGAPVPAQARVAKRIWKQIDGCNKKELLALADEFWATYTHELRRVAIDLLWHGSALLDKQDLPRLKRWVIESAGWAHVDTIATRVLAELIEKDASLLETMDKWATHSDFWVRRAAMLSLLISLRSGDLTQWPRFQSYAVPQLEEKEFFIRKAIGWVLRETSKKNPKAVREFIKEHKERMSSLTLREASKYL